MPLNKGKNVAISQVLSVEDQETVDYEVYHVSQRFHSRLVQWHALSRWLAIVLSACVLARNSWVSISFEAPK